MSNYAERINWVLGGKPANIDQAGCIASEADNEIERLKSYQSDLIEALRDVQMLISEAAGTGFNCHDGNWAERLFFSQQKTIDVLKRLDKDDSHPEISVNAQFECVDNGITGSMTAPVKRVEYQDDGSITAIIDHWPDSPQSINKSKDNGANIDSLVKAGEELKWAIISSPAFNQKYDDRIQDAIEDWMGATAFYTHQN